MTARRAGDTLASAGKAIEALDRQPIPELEAIRDVVGDDITRPRPVEQPAPEADSLTVRRRARRRSIRGRLLSPTALRDAIILTEILGPPKALRRTD